jgi:CIC family chloride channel protein
VIGALLMYNPAVMGVGYEYVDQALNGGLLLRTLVLLCVLKLTATIVSYTSGNAGGIFAPSLYIGAMAGGAVGMVVHTWAPFPTAEPGAYALVGMGTLFAGIVRAPMTSVFMIFEITQDYQILVPLMVANLLSFLISKRYQPLPVYEALLAQDNIHLPHGAPKVVTAARSARDVMTGDAHSVAQTPQLHVHPDHPLDIVLERLAQSGGELPVISRGDTRQVEGVITADSVFAFMSRRPRATAADPR